MVHRVLSLALVVTLSVTVVAAASAQEKFSDTRVFTVVKAETLPVGDVEGHVLVLTEMKGYDVQQNNVIVSRGVNDLVKGNGRTFGYGVSTNPDGDVVHYSYEGQVTTRPGPDGKPLTVAEGKWTLTGGTGKWQNRSGRGVFKNTSPGQGVSVAEWEGVWEPKK
jgi:hypothetical protein